MVSDAPSTENDRERIRVYVEQMLRQGADFLAEGQGQAACDCAKEALKLQPGHPLARNMLGIGFLERGRFNDAQQLFEDLIRRNPDVVPLRMNAGLAAMKQRELDTALEHFRRAVDLESRNTRAFGYLALVHLQRGEGSLAQAALREANLEALAAQIDPAGEARILTQLATAMELSIASLPSADQEAGASTAPHEGFVEAGLRLRSKQTTTSLQTATQADEPEVVDLDALGATEETQRGASEPQVTEELIIESIVDTLPQAPEAIEGEAAPEAATAAEESSEAREIEEVVAVEASDVIEEIDAGKDVQAVDDVEAMADAMEAEEEQPLLLRGHAAELWEGALVVRLATLQVAGQSRGAVIRRDQVYLQQGALSWNPAFRRRKGATEGPLICEEGPVMHATGDGVVVMHPGPDQRYHLHDLIDDAIYIRESDLAAFSHKLSWENGRIPEAGPDSPAMMYLRGSGFVALRIPGHIWTMPLSESTGSVIVRLSWLRGWSPDATPDRIERLDGNLHVGFSGAGMLWLALPPSAGGANHGS